MNELVFFPVIYFRHKVKDLLVSAHHNFTLSFASRS